MSQTQDKANYIKNMIWMMCCDGSIEDREKKFLGRAAKQIGLKVDNWNVLLKEVMADEAKLFPIQNRDRAIATLKSLVVMAKADRKLDDREKEYILRFAKSVGVSNEEWKRIRKEIDLGSMLDPFKAPETAAGSKGAAGTIVLLKDDFDKLHDFTEVAKEKDITTKIMGFDEFIATDGDDDDIVCFHASEDKDESVRKCRQLLEKSGERTAGIMTRYQGHQVKYMLEIGLKKCVIEPVYSQDIDKLTL